MPSVSPLAGNWPTPSGLLITVAILFVLKDAGRDIYRRLMDSVDPGLVDDVLRVLAAVPGVQVVESVRIRWIGHGLRAEAEVISDADLTLAEAHAIAEEGHHRLLHEIRRLEKVTIHSSPCRHDGRDHHSTTSHHLPPPAQARVPGFLEAGHRLLRIRARASER